MIGLAGRTLDRYTLGQRVGKGGMADVYLGYDPHFQRAVAIKIFKQDNDGMLLRFMREAQLMAALRHPHLMPIYDTGECEVDGVIRYYIVMPFIDGGTLGTRIRHSVLSPNEASSHLFVIASTLDYLHKHGIIHRDIKSTNVLLSTDGLCYLSDLGVARVLDDSSSLTTTGNVLGTVDYIAPELFVGKGKADARSDIYSLGVLLFEMVTGQRPFSAENQIAIASMHVNQAPPSPRSLLPTISPQVERVLLEALEKDPERRYPTAGTLANAFYRAAKARYPGNGPLLNQVDKQTEDLPPPTLAQLAMLNQRSSSHASKERKRASVLAGQQASTQQQKLSGDRLSSSPLATRKRTHLFVVISLLVMLLLIIAIPSVYLFYTQGSNKQNRASVNVAVQPHVIVTATATTAKKNATHTPVHNSTPTPVHSSTPSPIPVRTPVATAAPTASPMPTVAARSVLPASTNNLIWDPGYEMQTSGQVSPPWIGIGNPGSTGIDFYNHKARTGNNNAWILATADNTWSQVGQNVKVAPNTNYMLSVYIHTSGNINPSLTFFGVQGAMDGTVLQQIQFGPSTSSYTQLSITFNSGPESAVYVHIGSSNPSHAWIQIDDWSMHT